MLRIYAMMQVIGSNNFRPELLLNFCKWEIQAKNLKL